MAAKQYKLDLMSTLQAIDKRDLGFYSRLTDDERKGYAALVLMRYMSSLTDQNKSAAYSVIATNDLVNVDFWTLSKHTELQHLLLCLTGLGGKQYRPWIATKKNKKTNKIDDWILEQTPDANEDEISIIKQQYDLKSWTQLLKDSGASDSTVKSLVDEWKKQKA